MTRQTGNCSTLDARRENDQRHAWARAVGCDTQFRFKPFAEAQMTAAGPFDEGTPNSVGEAVADEQVPETVGALVEVGHGQVGKDGARVFGTATPDAER